MIYGISDFISIEFIFSSLKNPVLDSHPIYIKTQWEDMILLLVLSGQCATLGGSLHVLCFRQKSYFLRKEIFFLQGTSLIST